MTSSYLYGFRNRNLPASAKLWQKIVNNSLSIALFALFVVFLIGQGVSGFYMFNHAQKSHGLTELQFWQFLGTGTFLNGIFSNWQAALLQLMVLIVFEAIFLQQGASHSRKPGKDQRRNQDEEHEPWWKSNWIYQNSLTLSFLALFLASFILHIWFGHFAFNELRVHLHQRSLSVLEYFISPRFWFETLQTWQAEFFAIGMFVVLSIYLRQRGSAESKSPEQTDSDTGIKD